MLKIFLSGTLRRFSTKVCFSSTELGTKHPWVKLILVGSNEGPHPFPKGDNYKIAKIKKSSQEPLGQFQPHLASILG